MKQSFCVILSFFLLLVASNKNKNIANAIEVVQLDNFNIETFTNDNPSSLELQGNATVLADGTVQLTDPTIPASVGRVLYARPVPLWDNVTGKVANFITSFSLQITDYQDFVPADGIVFFLAPENTQIPGGGVGGSLGVADYRGVGEFVGVEFDNHVNGEFDDPPYSHVGIDANSVISLKTVEWNNLSGSVVNVTVIYDSSSKTMSVAMRNWNNQIVTVSEVVDLKEKLPPMVMLGFSAASSIGGRQLHVIRSWSYYSSVNLETKSDVATA